MSMQDLYFSLPTQKNSKKKWNQLSFPVDKACDIRLIASVALQLARFSGQRKIDILLKSTTNVLDEILAIGIDIDIEEANYLEDTVTAVETALKNASNYDVKFFDIENYDTKDSRYPLIIGDVSTIDGQFVNIFFDDNKVVIKYIEHHFNKKGIDLFFSEIENTYKSQRQNYADAIQRQVYPDPENSISTSIIDIFLNQVELTPEKIAIIDDNSELSYRQLNNCVMHLASQLQKNISEGDHVAVLLPRSSYSLIAMLAIAYCGAVYVPMDNKYPMPHLLHVVELTKPVIIIQSQSDERVIIEGKRSLVIENYFSNIKDITKREGYVNRTKRDLLLPFAVLFTSGSTGRAKAVVHNQLSFLCRFYWLWDTVPFNTHDVVAQRTTIGFGPHIWEFLGALLKGVKTIVLTDDTISDSTLLLTAIRDNGITRLSLVPSLVKQLVNHENIDEYCQHLQLCSIAGEAMSVDVLNSLIERLPNTKFYNDFGSAEANCLFFHQLSYTRAQRLPLGLPSSAARISILNEKSQPVLPFQPGILHVGGPTMALGYLDERGNLEPIYRKNHDTMDTGDVVYYEPSGVVIPLGRRDNLVKIRGMRVDLKNTESLLKKILGLEELSLSVQTTKRGEKQLIAFYTGPSKERRMLKKLVNKSLPEHFCPTYFYYIEKFPLLKNGKLDKQSLIALLKKRSINTSDSISERILDIICGLTELPLRLDKNIKENITDLGINSLLMASFLKEINKQFKLNWQLPDLAERNSIEAIVDFIEQKEASFSTNRKQETISLLEGDIKSICSLIAANDHIPSGKHILLTGATGFLGCFLLRHLLETRDCFIYCPVRANSDLSARSRFKKNLSRYGLDDISESSRVKVFSAYLDFPNLGLQEDEFESLAKSINEIFHCASEVNHIYSYSSLRQNHLAMWSNLTNIMNLSKIKEFHFISSIAANRKKDGFWPSEDLHREGSAVSSGYGQCK